MPRVRTRKKTVSIRRGRTPVKTILVARLLSKCIGWENGITIDEIARAIYGRADFHSKAKARQLIGSVRSALNVDIFSTKPVGRPERRYFHHNTVDEYNKAIDNFEKQITGLRETEKKLEIRKKTAEARRRLRLARKKEASSKEA
jgi:hypothetical protein